MPIRLPLGFPSVERLKNEGIESLSYERANKQDVRPLKVVLFNLMPTKIATEVQILRLLSRSSIQIEPVFLKTSTYSPKHSKEHLEKFYVDFESIESEKFDAIIITGAPVEQLKFEDVEYWDEFKKIVSWANRNVFSSFYICWGAQAGLYVDYGIDKVALNEKISGVYPLNPVYKNGKKSCVVLSRGLDDVFWAPQSRWTKLDESKLQKLIDENKLCAVAKGEDAGINIISTKDHRKVYVIGHFEYERNTLKDEYQRDLENGLNPKVPVNYFLDDNPNNSVKMLWKSAANLIFLNWIDFVYQETLYDLSKL